MEKKRSTLTNRQKQAIETKLHIYKTSMSLFTEKDYDSVKIPDLCKLAGVSVGTFYNYYTSKEDLILTAYRELDDYIESSFDPTEYASYMDAINALLDLQTKHSHKRGPFVYMQIMRVQLKTGGKYVIEENRAFNRYMLEILQDAVESGQLKSTVPATEIAATILRISRGILFDWAMRRADYDPNELIKKETSFYLRHI